MEDELENLLGVEEDDGERQCRQCGEHFTVREGDYVARLCQRCSNESACGGNDL